jgi:hypothetical protein
MVGSIALAVEPQFGGNSSFHAYRVHYCDGSSSPTAAQPPVRPERQKAALFGSLVASLLGARSTGTLGRNHTWWQREYAACRQTCLLLGRSGKPRQASVLSALIVRSPRNRRAVTGGRSRPSSNPCCSPSTLRQTAAPCHNRGYAPVTTRPVLVDLPPCDAARLFVVHRVQRCCVPRMLLRSRSRSAPFLLRAERPHARHRVRSQAFHRTIPPISAARPPFGLPSPREVTLGGKRV